MLSKDRIIWLPLLIVFFVIVFTSSFLISEYSFYDEKRIIQTFVLLISSFFFFWLIYQNIISGISYKLKIGFAVFLILLTVSAALAPLSNWAFLEIGWYILIVELVVFSSYLYLQDNQKFIQLSLLGLIAFCVIYSSRVYADYIIGSVHDYWTTWPNQRRYKIMYEGVNLFPSGFLGFSNYRFFNHMQTWSLPLLAFSYLYFKDRIIPGLRYLLLFFISSWWMLVFAADARGTMLASILSVVFILLLFRKQTLEFLKVYGYTALTGLILYLVLFLLPQSGGKEILTRFHDSGRLEVWLFSLEQIVQHPWLGLGPMHFSYMGINPPWSAPHNLFLQTATEWGIPAVLISAVLILYAFYHFVRQSLEITESGNRSNILNLRMALVASITAALVHSMFSGIYNTPLSQLLGAVILGAVLGEYYLYSGKELFRKREQRSWIVYAIIFLLAINTGFVAVKVSSDIPHLNEWKKEYTEKYNSMILYPRFWNQGMIYERNNGGQEKGEKETGSKTQVQNQDGRD